MDSLVLNLLTLLLFVGLNTLSYHVLSSRLPDYLLRRRQQRLINAYFQSAERIADESRDTSLLAETKSRIKTFITTTMVDVNPSTFKNEIFILLMNNGFIILAIGLSIDIVAMGCLSGALSIGFGVSALLHKIKDQKVQQDALVSLTGSLKINSGRDVALSIKALVDNDTTMETPFDVLHDALLGLRGVLSSDYFSDAAEREAIKSLSIVYLQRIDQAKRTLTQNGSHVNMSDVAE